MVSGPRGSKAVAAVLTGLVLLGGCADVDHGEAPGTEPAKTPGRWSDIDTTRPSEDPVATVYGYVQAMASADDAAACAFQYRGSSDFRDDPCVLDREAPRRDLRRTVEEWAGLAAYRLEDYEATDAGRHWRVTLPAEEDTRWRVRQDDAGLWFVD
ncbi:hypothetical protein [Nocardioides ferulae]|uniref:hypothetical protein n=1 Tax=Nocardioides ferulae TaxID=2340821 RepID=UPI000F88B2C1|nr:hypothetical protein [Nocardioides ferulae]